MQSWFLYGGMLFVPLTVSLGYVQLVAILNGKFWRENDDKLMLVKTIP